MGIQLAGFGLCQAACRHQLCTLSCRSLRRQSCESQQDSGRRQISRGGSCPSPLLLLCSGSTSKSSQAGVSDLLSTSSSAFRLLSIQIRHSRQMSHCAAAIGLRKKRCQAQIQVQLCLSGLTPSLRLSRVARAAHWPRRPSAIRCMRAIQRSKTLSRCSALAALCHRIQCHN